MIVRQQQIQETAQKPVHILYGTKVKSWKVSELHFLSSGLFKTQKGLDLDVSEQTTQEHINHLTKHEIRNTYMILGYSHFCLCWQDCMPRMSTVYTPVFE